MRRENPFPPSFFNSNYSKLSLLLLPLLIAVTVVTAAVFVYYPASITASWVDPPVRFQNPGTPGVSVTLYDDNTRAVVDVTITGDLVLSKRNAFIYDDFITNPFSPPARLTVSGSSRPGARWDSVNQRVIFDATTRESGTNGTYNIDHMVAYYTNQTPTGAIRVYLLMKSTRLSSAYGLWKGFFLSQSPISRLNYYAYEFWDSGQGTGNGMKIVRCWDPPPSPGYSTLIFNNVVDEGGQYIQWGVRNRVSGYMEYRIYGAPYTLPSTLSSTNTIYGDTPVFVGFGGALNRYEIIAFDDFVACADADPRFVNVTGLTPGWTVSLRDSGGSLVAQATADSNGVASLNVLIRPIVRNARFEISYGNIIILPSQSFSQVVGGDVYACNIRDMNILNFINQDSKAYSVYLKVESLSTPLGYAGSINLWIGSGTSTTPIQIVGSSIVVGTTSTITLPASGLSYIHGTASLSPPSSSPVTLNLSFHYIIPSSGVEVEYPVTVTIHR